MQSARAAASMSALVKSSLLDDLGARFPVAGLSMMPLVRAQDVLTVRCVADGEPRVGDVVVVGGGRDGSSILVHRVVRATRDGFVIRGDNTAVGNGEFRRDEILGVVAAVERDGRQVWFGAGRWGRLVALAARTGAINCYNRVRLKFLGADSRLPAQKGDDGNE